MPMFEPATPKFEPTTPKFEPEPELYAAQIDWPRRLERERPFYKRLFARVGVQRVLDAACGTGHHAAMFHDWGLHAEGADISPAMLTYCRNRWGDHDRLRWVERAFDQPSEPPGAFDAAICVGNSLAIAPDLDAVTAALRAMIVSLRPGGVLVAQLLNLFRFEEGGVCWQKCLRLDDGPEGRILLKGVHRVGSRGFVEIVLLTPGDRGVEHQSRTASLLGVEQAELLEAATRAGATEIGIWGDYEESAYQRAESQDLILVGRKAE